MTNWMLVDRHTHRIAKAPNGAWGMYCPRRGPDSLIYAATWPWVLNALGRGTACPHDALLYGPTTPQRHQTRPGVLPAGPDHPDAPQTLSGGTT